MEKFLLVINARKPDIKSIEFACRIAAYAQTKLTGFFIENLFFDYIPALETEYPSYFETIRKKAGATVTADTEEAIKIFKEECQRNGIIAKVYVDKGEPAREVIFESRFADLLIVDPGISFSGREEQTPSSFIKEILAKAECPVLLAPDKFESAEEIIFCYDNTASSVFAIKQFTYLLPELSNKKVYLLEVNKTGREEFNESHRRMIEWLKAHYHFVYYHAIKGDGKDELFTYFFMKTKKIIVMGAYGRSMLSNLFRKSSADSLLQMVDLPLFITHH